MKLFVLHTMKAFVLHTMKVFLLHNYIKNHSKPANENIYTFCVFKLNNSRLRLNGTALPTSRRVCVHRPEETDSKTLNKKNRKGSSTV